MTRFQGVRALALGLVLVGTVGTSAIAEAQRSTAGGAFLLELNGSQVGMVRGVSGGNAKAEVVSEQMVQGFAKKHLGPVTIEDLVLEIGAGMDKPAYDWIAAAWQGTASPATGAVLYATYDMNVVSRQEFSSAVLAETTIPELSAASKEQAYLTLTLRPESARRAAGAGTAKSALASGQKGWLASNFRVEISGLDCKHINKIDGFTIKQGTAKFPDLELTLSEASAATWYAWHKSFVIDGKNDESQERNGAIVFLAPDLQTELGRISLFNLGIAALRSDSPASDASAIKRVKAQLYCERMAFEWKGGTSTTNVLNTRTLLRQ